MIIASDFERGILVSDTGNADRPSASTTRLGTIFIDASGTGIAGSPLPAYMLTQTDAAGTRAWQQILTDSVLGGLYAGKTDTHLAPGPAVQNTPAGIGAIAPGAASAVITNNKVRATSVIIAVNLGRNDTGAEDATATRLWISNVANGSFTVSLNANATVAVRFAYWVLT